MSFRGCAVAMLIVLCLFIWFMEAFGLNGLASFLNSF
jgi:hypothetical protein